MQKQIFENLLNGSGCATSTDFLPEDKKRIFNVMSSKGMSDGTAYNRFFRDGFSPWELKGILQVMTDYVVSNALDSSLINDLPSFYKKLSDKTSFKLYMNSLGMGMNTTICRFNGFNFRQWELDGMKRVIMESLVDENDEEI